MTMPIDWWDLWLRLLLAGVMGIAVGLEREYRAKEAGSRTHFLVALGSALIMIVSKYGFYDILSAELIRLDPSRIAAQVVSGIGFLGAGTIILQKQIVRGLTTAAGIWATSGIGLVIGAGMYGIGVAATVMVLVGLELMGFWFKSIGMRNMQIEFTTPVHSAIKALTDQLRQQGYLLVGYEMSEEGHTPVVYRVSMVVKAKGINEEGLLLMLMQEFPEITVQRII